MTATLAPAMSQAIVTGTMSKPRFAPDAARVAQMKLLGDVFKKRTQEPAQPR